MGRRAPELHRRPGRRRSAPRIWWVLGFFFLALFLLFIVHHQHQDPSLMPIQETEFEELPREGLNFTQELLATTSFARQLIDQISLAKAYIIIAKEHGNLNLAWEFSSLVWKSQALLSQVAAAGKPVDLEAAFPIISHMSKLSYRAQDLHYDISTTITTLKKHVDALKERTVAAAVQSAGFGQLATESVPRDLHCLVAQLTEDWFEDPSLEELTEEQRTSPRLVDNNLYHFCVFSDNLVSTSVVVNSTVSNARHSQQLVFHIVTNEVNYRAMAAWFATNDFKGCTIDVRKIENLSLLGSKPRVSLDDLRFYLQRLYPQLEKVVFLEDDVVVQKDLTPLFSLDMHGNTIGAVETCLESTHRLYKYLNFSNPLVSTRFDPQACAWAFGVNVFDLIQWKKANATARYHYWRERNTEGMVWKAGTLPAGLLAFYGAVEALDRRWHAMGLGYRDDIDERVIESAAVLHFNGDRKPWLRLGVCRYEHLWRRYLDFLHPYVRSCFVIV